MRQVCLALLLPLFLTLLVGSCDSHKRASSADSSTLSSPDSGATASPDAGSPLSPDASFPGSPVGGSPSYPFPAEIVAKGCAKVLACANNAVSGIAYGVGHCVSVLTEMGALDLTRQTYFMSVLYDDYDWILDLSLMQNMACVQGASDCSAILACVNQGQAQPTCTPTEDYPRWRRCSDANHLRGCSAGVGATFDCSKLGLGCIETTAGTSTFAGCATPVAGSQPADATVQVTCQGDEAYFTLGLGKYNFNCNDFGATCVPGSYDLSSSDAPLFCRGKRATACDPSTSGPRCEGKTWIICMGGQEAASDCASWGATCRPDPGSAKPSCGFQCTSTLEVCAAGTVSYCGPAGMTTLDCGSVGFSTCDTQGGSDATEAWCSP